MGFLGRVLKTAVSGFLANDALSRGTSRRPHRWRPCFSSSLPSQAWLSGRMPPVPRSVRNSAGCWGGDFINSILERSSDSTSGATATLVGVVAVLVTASGVFGEMRTALNTTLKSQAE